MDQSINIIYTCQVCNKKQNKIKQDKTGYYENKILGDRGDFRCSKCTLIKPINNFSLVSAHTSSRRRKACDECRKKQMRDRYYKRKEEKIKLVKT